MAKKSCNLILIGLETFSILYRTAYREQLKGIIQFDCLGRDKTFVGVHIDDFLNNPVGALLVRGIEFVAYGLEFAYELLVSDYERRSGTNST